MSTIWIRRRKMSMTAQRNMQSARCSRAITLRSWPMGRLAQVRRILWKALSIRAATRTEVSYQGPWRTFSLSFSIRRIKIQRLWFVPPICKSITRSFLTCSRLRGQACRYVRIVKKVSSSKAYPSGLSAPPTKSTVLCSAEP